jgi:hypothetical protein
MLFLQPLGSKYSSKHVVSDTLNTLQMELLNALHINVEL